ncbi:MAG: PLP-dependent aminotransferase family protein [Nocardioidaceae bacterium]
MITLTALRLAFLIGPDALDGSPAYRSLSDAIRLVIADGRISPGTRLPSERDLTAVLGTSRTTVTSAYRELKECGYLSSRRGSGSVATLPGGGGELSQHALIPLHGRNAAEEIDLTCAILPAALGIATAYEAATAELPRWLRRGGYDAQGLPDLRETIASAYAGRGLPTDPAQIMVTSGALSALAIVLRALVRTGDRMLMENPTYPNALDTATHAGARLTTLPLDDQGWDLELLEATLRQTSPRVAYLMPDFHNPTGQLMTDTQRETAARMLRRNHTTVVVDETMADLRLSPNLSDVPRPLPFAAYDDRAVLLGSMSKSYWGGLRIGWIRAPQAMLPELLESRATLELSSPVLEQLAATHLIQRRDEIIPERLDRLRAQRDALVEALRAELPDWDVPVPAGGMSLWCRMPERVSSALTAAAPRHGLQLAPGRSFGVDGGFEHYLRVPYGQPVEVLEAASERIAAAYREATSSPAASPALTARGPLIA